MKQTFGKSKPRLAILPLHSSSGPANIRRPDSSFTGNPIVVNECFSMKRLIIRALPRMITSKNTGPKSTSHEVGKSNIFHRQVCTCWFSSQYRSPLSMLPSRGLVYERRKSPPPLNQVAGSNKVNHTISHIRIPDGCGQFPELVGFRGLFLQFTRNVA